MSSETTVGGIVGFLRLDNDQFVRAIDQAIGKSEQLDGKQIDVQVDADTAGANAQLAATKRQVEDLDRANAKVATSGKSAGRGMAPLVAAVIGLGPAMVPVAAGAAALGAAFGGMATAGIFAVVGIKKEMEDGTTVGLAYQSAIDGAKDDLTDLGRVAARNVLQPFLQVVDDLNGRMPALRGQIGDLATVTGRTAAALSSGLLSAFQALEPLMRDAAVYILGLSRSFERAMSGQGVVAFGDYVRSVFPQVLDALGSIASAAGHLVQSLAPLGLGVLSGLQLLSDLLRTIPADVLSTLATGAYSVWLGFRVWKGITGLVDSASAALGRMNGALALSAGALRAVNIAAGVIGLALAGLSFVISANAESTRNAEEAANRYADALRASNGAIDESIRKSAAKALADKGVLDAARDLGISLSDVTSAALGNAEAQARVNKVTGQFSTEQSKAAQALDERAAKMGKNAELITSAIGTENTALHEGMQKQKDLAAATATSSGALDAQAVAAQALAAQYGTSAATYQEAATQQSEIASKAAAATVQMQLENNAAGLLKLSLDALNGEAITAAQAQNGFDRAMLAVGQSTRNAKGAIDSARTSLKGNSEAAVTNRGNLLGLATQASSVAEAFGNQANSSEVGRKKLITLREQIIKNAVAQGMNRDEVIKFIDSVLKIPKKVPPTKADLDKAAADRKIEALKRHINSITDKVVTVTVATRYTEIVARSRRSGKGPLENENGSVSLASGVTAMADGGVREPMMMRSMRPILWNEAPGGEAYIPLAPQKRARATALWERTGRELGVSSGGAQIDYARLAEAVATALRSVPTPAVRANLMVDGRQAGVLVAAGSAANARLGGRR